MIRGIPVRPQLHSVAITERVGGKHRNGGHMGPEAPIEKQSSFNALAREAGGARCWRVIERNPSANSR